MKTEYKIQHQDGYCSVFKGSKKVTGGIVSTEQALQAIWVLEGSNPKDRYIQIGDSIYKARVLETPIEVNNEKAFYHIGEWYLTKEAKIIGEERK
jgi:serine protease inhibitor